MKFSSLTLILTIQILVNAITVHVDVKVSDNPTNRDLEAALAGILAIANV
jgi:hypothetical protein